jgi:Holliday junction resolvase RusA-like endonuclease
MAANDNPPDVSVVLPGEPKGKGAPRARVISAKGRTFAHIYPDPETKSYEGMLRQVAALAMRERNPLASALRVRVIAHMSIPASWSESKKTAALAGYVRPTVKPDWENIAKTLDALTGVVWVDDKQIVSGVIEKFYAAKPQLVVDVWEQRGALI